MIELIRNWWHLYKSKKVLRHVLKETTKAKDMVAEGMFNQDMLSLKFLALLEVRDVLDKGINLIRGNLDRINTSNWQECLNDVKKLGNDINVAREGMIKAAIFDKKFGK